MRPSGKKVRVAPDLVAAVDAAMVLDGGPQVLRVPHEAGPQVHGALIADGLIDDAFLTLSPIMVGETEAQTRPSLVEGVAFGWEAPPQMRLLSLHRNGSYLYLHSRYER